MGNAGGPGRPPHAHATCIRFIREIEQMIETPEKFNPRQRKALVRLLTSFVEDFGDERAIEAASILVRMSA